MKIEMEISLHLRSFSRIARRAKLLFCSFLWEIIDTCLALPVTCFSGYLLLTNLY